MNQVATSGASASADPVPQNSPEFPKINSANSPNELSSQQLSAIAGILSGLNQTEAAANAGVDRKTLFNWRHHDAGFRAGLRRRQEMLWQSAIDRVHALVPKAIANLADDLDRGNGATRARAAASVLRLTNFRTILKTKPPEE